jgi:uncharacterized membrane protein
MASSKARSKNRPAAPARSSCNRGGGRSAATATAARPSAKKAPQRRQPVPEPVEETPSGPPLWVQLLALLLALGGLGVSIYLTYAHYTDSSLAGCHETSGLVNCGEVTTSSQSMIFGVIPVALTGLIYYVFMVAIMSPWAWKSTWEWMPKIRLAAAVGGMGMVLYLVYAELLQIRAICLYCTSVHIITFLIFTLMVISAALWGLSPARRPATDAS